MPTPPPDPEKSPADAKPCSSCRGSGKCWVCDGTGEHGGPQCGNCWGSGRCPRCSGAGVA